MELKTLVNIVFIYWVIGGFLIVSVFFRYGLRYGWYRFLNINKNDELYTEIRNKNRILNIVILCSCAPGIVLILYLIFIS